MNLLLDTHVALWALVDSPRLGATARALIDDPGNTVHVSVVSLWEISIKRGLGRGDMPISSGDAAGYFREAGYLLLPVAAEHAVAVESLPPIHADPFDRLLVAQALVEPMRLVTHDASIARYSVAIVRV